MNEVLDKLVELQARCESRAGLSRSQEEFIERNHLLVMGKPFARRSCSNCYHDAIILMLLTLRKKGFMKNVSRFVLPNGRVLVNAKAGLPVVSCVNLTDELAIAHLRANPRALRFFSAYPDNVEELLAGKQAAEEAEKQAAEAAKKQAEEAEKQAAEAAKKQAEEAEKQAAEAAKKQAAAAAKAAEKAAKKAAEAAAKEASNANVNVPPLPGVVVDPKDVYEI
jgi:flagellar biosynthesis GTPase FlhF